MSDRRVRPISGRVTPRDDVERQARDDLARRPKLPLLMVPGTALRTQSIKLGDGQGGVAVEVSNSIVSATFPMDLAQARAHVDDVERSMMEAGGVTFPAEGDAGADEP